jgi:hypothetical protein
MGMYTRKNATGDAGEYLTGYAFAGKLGWAYRILDSDTGIDGEVEIYDGEEPTGRLIKVQVKSTAKPRQAGGATEGDDEDHAEAEPGGFKISVKKVDVTYWRLLSLPVVLCVADIAAGKVYFRIIDDTAKIPDTKSATFSVFIPIESEVAEAARAGLSGAAPRTFDPLNELLDQVQAKLDEVRAAGGGAYAFDKGEALRLLRGEQNKLTTSIRTLTTVGGWILSVEGQKRVDQLLADLHRAICDVDFESMQWENS